MHTLGIEVTPRHARSSRIMISDMHWTLARPAMARMSPASVLAWEAPMDTDDALLDRLLAQEEALQFTQFTNETAFELGLRFVEVGRKEGLGITVDIRRGAQQLFHCALPGTSADNDAWIERKIRVVNRFGHSSFYMSRLYASQNSTIEEKALLDPREYAAHGGAFPISVKDVGPVGTITVSGLPQQEDHALVVRVLADFLGVSLDDDI